MAGMKRRDLLSGTAWMTLLLPQHSYVAVLSGANGIRLVGDVGRTPPPVKSPITFPDGFGPGMYFPSTVYFNSKYSNANASIVSGFARFATANPQVWTVKGSPNVQIGGPNGSTLYGYNTPGGTSATVALTVSVTDGVTVLSRTVTLKVSPSVVTSCVNYILDTAGPSGQFSNNPRVHAASGAPVNPYSSNPTINDATGLFQIDSFTGRICTTDAAYPASAHFGAYSLPLVNGNYTQPNTMYFIHEQPASVGFVPVPRGVYDWHPTLAEYGQNQLPVAAAIGKIDATSDGGVATIAISSPGSVLSVGWDGTVYALKALTAGANQTAAATVTSSNGVVTTLPFTYTVLAGTMLAPSNLKVRFPQALDNAMCFKHPDNNLAVYGLGTNCNGIAANLDVTGLKGAITWEIHVMADECQELGVDAGTWGTSTKPRYSVVSTGATTANLMFSYLSAQTDVVEVRASDASGNCVHKSVSVVVAAKVGPNISIGPAGSGATFAKGDDFLNAVWASPAACAHYAGAIVTLMPQDYSTDWSRPDRGHGQGVADLGLGYRRSYFPCPVTITGSGRVGAVVLDFKGIAPGLSAQAGLVFQGFDATLRKITIKNVGQAFEGAGEPNAGALYKTEDQPGNLLVEDVHLYNGNDCFIGGTRGNHLTFNRVTFAWGGTGDYGLTHNVYIGYPSSVTFNACVSYGTTSGNTIKSRAARSTFINTLSVDTNNANASTEIDLSVGGIVNISGGAIQKGPNPNNNGHMIQFAFESDRVYAANKLPWPSNTLDLDGVSFINSSPVGAITSNVYAVSCGGLNANGASLGLPITGTNTNALMTAVLTNCTFWNIPAAQWVGSFANGITPRLGAGNAAATSYPGIPFDDPSMNAPYTDLPGPSYSQYAGQYEGIVLPPPAFDIKIAAGAAAGTVVTSPKAYDKNGYALTSTTWGLSGYNSALFTIDPTTGIIRVAGTITDKPYWMTISASGRSPTQGIKSLTHNICVIGGNGFVAAA